MLPTAGRPTAEHLIHRVIGPATLGLLGAITLCVALCVLSRSDIDGIDAHGAKSTDLSVCARTTPSSVTGASGPEILALQPKILAQALAALEPPRPGRINLYFVGFAGTSAQDVFRKEVQAVATQFKRRFVTTGHSIVLINNQATLREYPIATPAGLAHALGRIGALINPRRDIVFLYLSSHGSPDHELSVSFPPLSLSDITPVQLRKMLDAAGIKRRVVVISACYSGGFIKALKSADSLVITAAAANRASFGCSNEADYTYFGRAYFDDALRRTNSFIEAYHLAQPIIAAHETREGFKHSNPQMFRGKNIAVALDRLAREWPPVGR